MQLLAGLLLAAAVGAGTVGGLFFAFSNAVIPALDRGPPGHAVAAMQRINAVILNPLFLGLFLGTGALCLLLGVVLLGRVGEPAGAFGLVGALSYLLGSVGVTAGRNVPLNAALARADAARPQAASWRAYSRRWRRWNSLRTLACVAASACFTLALRHL